MPIKWGAAAILSGAGAALSLALLLGSRSWSRPSPGAAGGVNIGRVSPPTAPGPDPEAQGRGKRIYHEGEGRPDRPITAVLQGSAVAVPGSLVRCTNCHGEDGRGRPEGGLDPPDLTWSALSTPAGAR